jgi:polyhydroxyalkanoate synthesis regulator phasin
MTTHTHPEIHADILELSKSISSEIGDSEERLRADMHKMQDKLESDIAGLQSDMKDLKSDVKTIKDFLLPPKP